MGIYRKQRRTGLNPYSTGSNSNKDAYDKRHRTLVLILILLEVTQIL